MRERFTQKLHTRRGFSLLILVLLVGVIALAVAVAVPAVRSYREQAEKIACETAMDSAYRALTAEFLLKMDTMTPREARAALAAAMPEKEGICPGGGDVYLLPRENGTYDLFCGLHGEDVKKRTSLNGENVWEQVEETLEKLRRRGETPPDALEVTLHSKPLAVMRVGEKVDLHLGTRLTPGYEGTVALYIPDGTGGLLWMCYADENGWVTFGDSGGSGT